MVAVRYDAEVVGEQLAQSPLEARGGVVESVRYYTSVLNHPLDPVLFTVETRGQDRNMLAEDIQHDVFTAANREDAFARFILDAHGILESQFKPNTTAQNDLGHPDNSPSAWDPEGMVANGHEELQPFATIDETLEFLDEQVLGVELALARVDAEQSVAAMQNS